MSTQQVSKSKIVFESEPLSLEEINEAKIRREETFSRDSAANGVIVADGGVVKIFVERGGLQIEDGRGENRRLRRFEKATHRLSRVVIIGPTGNISLDALSWLRKLDIPLVILSPNGEMSFSSSTRLAGDARLRRIQATSADSAVGLEISQYLMKKKLNGQARLVRRIFGDEKTAELIEEMSSALEEISSLEEIRPLEAAAASLYWQSWSGRSETVPLFLSRDRKRVPPHWQRFEGRRSVLASMSSNRKAERPTNAILNYLYSLLEVEATIACQALGLDPGLGLMHSDVKGRESFVLDLLEPLRPLVDSYVLELLATRTFKKGDFLETPDGHCRLLAPLTHELAESLSLWAKEIAPIAEYVAHLYGKSLGGKYVAATPLTRDRTKAAQAVAKARRQSAAGTLFDSVASQKPTTERIVKSSSCIQCGAVVSNSRHVRCAACIEADPQQTTEARSRRGAAIASRKKALKVWEESHPDIPYDPDYFRREILPGLATIKLTEIMKTAGISKSFASRVRSGHFEPHVSTWGDLAGLIRDFRDNVTEER